MRALGTASPMQRKPAKAKTGLTARLRARRRSKKLAEETAIKAMVRIREAQICRVCPRRLESVHEIQSKGAGGVVSLENSIGVCGDGVRGCHGFLQRYEILVEALGGGPIDANLPLVFTPVSGAARKWIEDGR